MRLTDEELRDVLARADEIDRARRSRELNVEVETVIAAAEEIGLSRSSVEHALRERNHLPVAPPSPGEFTFATSADGKAYAAEVLSVSADAVRVRFLRGSEYVVSPDQLRPCALVPGEKVVCNWPWWGPWTCNIISYDAATQMLELSDGWGDTHSCQLAHVWLAAPKKPKASGTNAALRRAMILLGAGAGIGALIGSVLTGLLMR